MPDSAPSSGVSMNRSDPPGPAASTIPLDTPKRILRGFRLATITVRRPIRSSGLYAALMPANTVRVSMPMSRVSSTSLSAASTAFASTIVATRRSTLLKSSISISGFNGSCPPPVEPDAPALVAALAASPASRVSSRIFSICLVSTRVIIGL